jgi:hypothetical protein
MPNFVVDGAIGVDLDTVASANSSETGKYGVRAALGETHEGNQASEWIFVMATSAITAGSMVCIEGDNTVTALVGNNFTSANRRIGFAQTAFAISQYGFVATRGNSILIRLLGGVGGGGGQPLFTTDTAGCLSTATNTASQWPIWGVYLSSSASAVAATAGTFTAAVAWPMRGQIIQR